MKRVNAALCAVAQHSWQSTAETLPCRVKVDTHSKSKHASLLTGLPLTSICTPVPSSRPLLPCRVKIDTYSKSKYASVIRQAGGWEWFQELLGALQGVAQRHGVTIADVAVRWVLDRPQASARLNITGQGGSRASLLRQGAVPPCTEDATAAGGGGGQARRSRSGCQAPGGLAHASPAVMRAAAAAPCCVACAGGGRDCGRAQRQPRG